jgi:hypothetical protein
MKIIIRNENKVSYYVFNDSDELVVEENRITTPSFIIGDMGSSNATIYEDITDVPEDWENDKYIYDDSAEPKWSLIPPEEEPVSEEQISEEPVVEEAPTDA